MSWAESKWIVDSLLQKIGQAPNNMRTFAALPLSKTSIGLRFSEPADSYANGNLICSVAGVVIRMSTGGYPTSPSEGTLVADNKNLGAYATDPFVIENLTEGTPYYFSAFPYSAPGVFNLSNHAGNRATATPVGGEKVTVNVTIDNTEGFSGATITCVNETDATATQSKTVTKTSKTVSFVVPIGDTYHIEYGAVSAYSKPSNTAAKVSVAGASTTYSGTYRYFASTINVTYPAGAALTCTCGSTVYTATTSTGSYRFTVRKTGTWTVKAVQGAYQESAAVSITADGQAKSVTLVFANIYGISRNVSSSSSAWTRTDGAVGKTATASIATAAGSSDFSACYPWSGIVRETLSTGDVMVKIPKFYYRRYQEGNVEYIKIADKAASGFAVHPLFNHAGIEKSCAYIGAYETSSLTKSVPNARPNEGRTRADFRTHAKSKGSGWGLIDIAALSAIQMLVLVEFATYDVQTAIGKGYSSFTNFDSSVVRVTGTADSVPNLTGIPTTSDGYDQVVWRGIEGLWGNVEEYIDGVNWNNGTYYVCNDPSKYADDTEANYQKLSFTGNVNWGYDKYITREGIDAGENSHVLLPAEAAGGSSTTYMCDVCSAATGWRVFRYGGYWYSQGKAGLFTIDMAYGSDNVITRAGARLLYIPS